MTTNSISGVTNSSLPRTNNPDSQNPNLDVENLAAQLAADLGKLFFDNDPKLVDQIKAELTELHNVLESLGDTTNAKGVDALLAMVDIQTKDGKSMDSGAFDACFLGLADIAHQYS
jgi:hypothetical protein